MSLGIRRFAAGLALAGLLLSTPGPQAYAAAGQGWRGGEPRAAMPSIAPATGLPSIPAFPALSLPSLPPMAPAITPEAVAAQASLETAAAPRSSADAPRTTDQEKAEAGRIFEKQAGRPDFETAVLAAPMEGSQPTPLTQAQPEGSDQGREPAPPAPPQKPAVSRTWLTRTLVLAGVFLALDWGIKTAVVALGIPHVFHAVGPTRRLLAQMVIGSTAASAAYSLSLAHGREPLTKRVAAIRAKHKVLGAALAGVLYVLNFDLFKFKAKLPDNGYGGDMVGKYPQVARAMAIMDAAWAGMIAGVVGNGLGVIFQGGAVDFIPFGHARLNLADIGIFLGIPLMEMARKFLDAARLSHESGKPMAMKFSGLYRWPVLGILIFYFSTWLGYKDLPEISWYVLLFSSIFSLTILISHSIFERLAQAFNDGLKR